MDKSKSKYKSVLTKEFLHEEHIVKGKHLLQIAKEVGCDRNTVQTWLHFHEIEYKVGLHALPMNKHQRWSGRGDLSLTHFNNIRHNAKVRKLEFDVTIDQLWDLYVSQQERCALSGQKIGFVSSRVGSASLDRIDSSLGYFLDNVRWVHKDVNYAKQSLSDAQFFELCGMVLDWQKA